MGLDSHIYISGRPVVHPENLESCREVHYWRKNHSLHERMTELYAKRGVYWHGSDRFILELTIHDQELIRPHLDREKFQQVQDALENGLWVYYECS